jgi:AraC-like DNA-binding protein
VQRLHDDLDVDAVDEVLTTLRVRSTIYCRSELNAPWGFAVKPAEVSVFHLISAGSGWLEVNDLDDPVRLEIGDVVLLMTGRGHRLTDDRSSKTEWLDEILERTPPSEGRLIYGGTGPRTEMICGHFQIEGAQANPLLMSLPPLLRLERNDPATAEWVKALLAMLQHEVSHQQPGGGAMLARLADILITQAIRNFLISLANTDQPHFGALRNPRIAKAVRLFQSDPSRPWTVEDMANEVAMSRSSFAAAFRQLTGESPMRYLTRCRLARAASHLASGDMTVFAIAREVGYDSEASLTKAFSRTFGVAPGAYRKRLREGSDLKVVEILPEVIADGNGDTVA